MGVTQEYTIADGASTKEREAVCRAVLCVVWPDLSWFDLDLAGLGVDAPTAAAVARLEPYRTKTMLGLGRRFTTTAHLVPERDHSLLDAALELAGKTTGSTGLTKDARMIYDVNDGGTSCVFELTDDQHVEVERVLVHQGLGDHLLVRWPR